MQRRTSSTNSEAALQINDLELQRAYDELDVNNKLAQTESEYLSRISGDQFTTLQGEIVVLKKKLTDMRARLLVIHMQNKKSGGKSQHDVYSKEYKQLDAQDRVFFISESVFQNMKILKSTIETSIKEADVAIAKLIELSVDLSERLKIKAQVRERKALESESESKSKHRQKSKHRHRKKSRDGESETEVEDAKGKPESKPVNWLSHDLLKFAAGDYNARAFFPCGKTKKIKEAIDVMLDDTKTIKEKFRYFEAFQSDTKADTKEQQLVQTLHMLVAHQNNVLENDDHWLTQNQIDNIVDEYTKERDAFFSCPSKTEDNLVSFLKKPDSLLNYKWIAIDYFLDIKGSNKLKDIIQRSRKNNDLAHDEKVEFTR